MSWIYFDSIFFSCYAVRGLPWKFKSQQNKRVLLTEGGRLLFSNDKRYESPAGDHDASLNDICEVDSELAADKTTCFKFVNNNILSFIHLQLSLCPGSQGC